MSCCNSQPMRVIPPMILSTEAGFPNNFLSAPVDMSGDDLGIAVSIFNISGTGPQLAIQVRGSIDGTFWQDVGAPLTRTSFGPLFGNINNVQYKFIQVLATFTNSAGTGNCYFSVTLYGRMSA